MFGIFLNLQTPRALPGKRRITACQLGLVLAATALSGCTKFASELDERETTDTLELSNELGSSGADWSCASENSVSTPLPVNTQRPLTYSLRAANFISSAPVTSLRVRACFRSDVECTSPATPYFSAAADGLVSVPIYEGFNGYLEVLSDGMLPAMIFFAEPWSADLLRLTEQVPIALLPIPALVALSDSARVQLDPTGGVVSINTFDCNGPFAAGVRLEMDTAAIPYAFVDDLPVAYRDVTSADGLAGFVNVPPGVVVVTAYPDDGQRAISVDTFVVRTAWVTSQNLIPPRLPTLIPPLAR